MPVQVCPATNDQIDIPSGRFAAELTSAHPRPRPRGNSASNARLTTSLMDKRFFVGVLPDPLNQAAWKFHCECQFRFAGWNRRLQLLSLFEVTVGLAQRDGAIPRQAFGRI